MLELYSDWGAETIEEVRWLQRHGFPDKAQVELLSNADLAALRLMTSQGDVVAQTFLGERLALNDATRNEGLGLLADAAARGSVRAVSVTGEVVGRMQTDSLSCRDPFAAANFLAAAMLGDTGAIHGYMLCNSRLSSEAQILVVGWAAAIISNIERNRSELYGGVSRIDPRPGLEERINRHLASGQQPGG